MNDFLCLCLWVCVYSALLCHWFVGAAEVSSDSVNASPSNSFLTGVGVPGPYQGGIAPGQGVLCTLIGLMLLS